MVHIKIYVNRELRGIKRAASLFRSVPLHSLKYIAISAQTQM